MSLEPKDLTDRIKDTVHFDEYVPKMGREEDVIVSSFKVFGKEPARDLEHFIERGYDWVLDAESTPGEMEDGDYLVFVESERDMNFPKNFMMLEKKQRLDEAREIVKTEELWDQMKKDI